MIINELKKEVIDMFIPCVHFQVQWYVVEIENEMYWIIQYLAKIEEEG